MLREIRQSQKCKYDMISLTGGTRSSHINKRQDAEWWLPGTTGGEMENYCLVGIVSVLQDEKRSGDGMGMIAQ